MAEAVDQVEHLQMPEQVEQHRHQDKATQEQHQVQHLDLQVVAAEQAQQVQM
jgi:hypothetical protein